MKEIFRILSSRIANAVGTATAFCLALSVVIVWAFTGPAFHFSDTWQLVINTGTTIVTFLMVFLIQNTQNRDSKAMQLKLDELIRSSKTARMSFIDLEDLTDMDLAKIDEEFKQVHASLPPDAAIHKLHHKILVEHSRRKQFKNQAGQVINSILPHHTDR